LLPIRAVPLLERRDGRLAPTRLGRVLYEGACDVLAQLTLLEKRLHDMVSDETHQIAVSCTRTVAKPRWPRSFRNSLRHIRNSS